MKKIFKMLPILILFIVFLSGIFNNFRIMRLYLKHDSNAMSEVNRRFSGLSGYFPPGTVVGYITDDANYRKKGSGILTYPKSDVFGSKSEKQPEKCFINNTSTPEYYKVQNALTPLVVDNSPFHEYVFGNFKFPVVDSFMIRSGQLRIKKDFGNGVYILQRQEK